MQARRRRHIDEDPELRSGRAPKGCGSHAWLTIAVCGLCVQLGMGTNSKMTNYPCAALGHVGRSTPPSSAVIKLLEAAGSVQRFCQEQGWRFCAIEGLALQRWAEPRLTR